MAASARFAQSLARLPVAPASAVKKDGWRGIVRTLAAGEGRLLVTNHNEPEAVILSIAEYTGMVDALQAAREAAPDPMAELRQRFDQRLAALKDASAADRLRDIMRNPGKLDGGVKAGSTY